MVVFDSLALKTVCLLSITKAGRIAVRSKMKRTKPARLAIVLCLFFLPIQQSQSETDVSIFHYSLPDLQSKNMYSMAGLKGSWTLLSFFEPECRWCFRQMKVFNQLSSLCDQSLKMLAIGINGSNQQLRQELRKAKTVFPGLKATPAFRHAFGPVTVTPWTLIVDPHGETIATIRGYKSYDQFIQVFSQQCRASHSS